ncbi:MAG: hypothetical protein ABIH11_07955 [Candidatus Altiarchaeota archaeon]
MARGSNYRLCGGAGNELARLRAREVKTRHEAEVSKSELRDVESHHLEFGCDSSRRIKKDKRGL